MDKNQRSYWGEGGRKKTSDQKFAAGRGLWCEPFKQIQQGLAGQDDKYSLFASTVVSHGEDLNTLESLIFVQHKNWKCFNLTLKVLLIFLLIYHVKTW